MKASYHIISLALIGILAGCKQSESDPSSVSKKPGTDSIAVFILHKDTARKQLNFPAELLPMERAEIVSKVTGYVGILRVDIGDHVSKGQVLAVLEAPEMKATYAQANAEVQTVRSKYLGSLDTYHRLVDASHTEGTIAIGELEKAKAQMQADSAALTAARAKTNAYAEMNSYLTIRAPFNGVITQRNVDRGALVSTTNAKPLFILEDISSLRLRIPVPEMYTATAASAVITFTVDARPDIIYKASLSRKAGSLNLTNRAETWEFLYNNHAGQLKSGMYATAILQLGRQAPTFLVPPSAVATNLEKRFVIRLNNGKAEWVDVRNGMTVADKTEVFGNLNEGDTLLTRATDELKPQTVISSPRKVNK
jgi:RND family efflux transporter MFP subunit